MLPDPRLHEVRIHVAHDGHRHQRRSIPAGIEVPEILDTAVLDHQRVADGLAERVAGVAQDFLQERIARVLARLAALQALGKDDPPFLLHLDGVDREAPRPVAQDQHRRVHQGGIAGRKLQFINRFPIGGMGVQVRAEGSAVALQHPDDAVVREVLRPVEGHVLQEMRKAPLALLLIERARLHEKPVHRLPFRIGVLEDIIGQAVSQGPHAEGVPLRKRFLPRGERQGGTKKKEGQDRTFLHGSSLSLGFATEINGGPCGRRTSPCASSHAPCGRRRRKASPLRRAGRRNARPKASALLRCRLQSIRNQAVSAQDWSP